MTQQIVNASRILDAAADIIVDGGFDRVTLDRVADAAGTSKAEIISEFGSLEETLIVMLNREFTGIYLSTVDQIERDPRGGLLSRIYFYTFAAMYERPLAKVLYTTDRDAMNSILRSANSLGYMPGVGLRTSFIESMQRVGMVKQDLDAEMVSHMITIFSAGLAITAPHRDLDLVVSGITDLIARSIDAEVDDTTPGKVVYYDWATSL
jgi:AcrR family transcriptional regulator